MMVGLNYFCFVQCTWYSLYVRTIYMPSPLLIWPVEKIKNYIKRRNNLENKLNYIQSRSLFSFY
jgi:hypothetical protein